MSGPVEGDTHTFERAFTETEVRQFAALSGDDQPRHTEPNGSGRLLVHGLLTATLPTKIGGDLEVLAREMRFEFRRPVHTGETVTCEWTHETVEEREDRYAVIADVVCTNGSGKTVMTAEVEGFVRKEND